MEQIQKLKQHINFPTHTHGHTLDLVCSTGLTVHHLSSTDLTISDHLAITMDVNIPIPKDERNITFRNVKSITPPALLASLTTKLTMPSHVPLDNPSDLLTHYNHTLSASLEEPIRQDWQTFFSLVHC